MSHRIGHKDIAAMDATRGKYSYGGEVRTKKAFGDRITKENIKEAADKVAPLVASKAIGFPAGPLAYEGIKGAYKNIAGEPGQQRRQKRKIRRAERRARRKKEE